MRNIKALLLLILILFTASCASTDYSKSDEPHMVYGGSFQVRGTISHGTLGP